MALGAVRGHGKHNCPMDKELTMAFPEYRLIAGSGQDRSATQRSARTTDKGPENLGIYSLASRNNQMKREINIANDRRIHRAGC